MFIYNIIYIINIIYKKILQIIQSIFNSLRIIKTTI